LVQHLARRGGHDRGNGNGEIANGHEQGKQHGAHPFRIGLAQRPRRLLVDIGVAGKDGAHPRIDPARKVQGCEFAGQFDRTGVMNVRQQRVVRLGARKRPACHPCS
jgi:hypothetical protein